MPVISGGRIIEESTANPGIMPRIYQAPGVPTDTNLGYIGTPPNGALAVDITNGNLYERTAGTWTRRDTL